MTPHEEDENAGVLQLRCRVSETILWSVSRANGNACLGTKQLQLCFPDCVLLVFPPQQHFCPTQQALPALLPEAMHEAWL